MSQHPLDETLQLVSAGTAYTGQITPAWGNMIGPYGGAIAAVMLQAVLQHAARLGEPLSLTVNYAAPLAAVPFRVEATPLRTNKSSQHWQVVLTQAEGEPLVTASVITANRRESWSATELTMPEAPAADTLKPLPALPMLPAWVANYDLRFVKGPLTLDPAQPSVDSETLLWIRDKAPRPLDFLSLAAMSDNFFPRIFLRAQKLVPTGTITLTTYFHADSAVLAQQGTQPLLARAVGTRFFKGYFDQRGELWGSDGNLLATTYQLVYFKA